MAGRPHDADEPAARRDPDAPGGPDLPHGDAATDGAAPDEQPREGGPTGRQGGVASGEHGDGQSGGPYDRQSGEPHDRQSCEQHDRQSGEPDDRPGGTAPGGGAENAESSTADVPGAPDDPVPARGAPRADRGDAVDDDIDERWRAIVAELGDLGSVPPSTPRRRATDIPPEAGATAAGARTVRPAQPTGPRSWEPDPAVEEAEEHFTPPDPGPVLGGDPLLTMAWVAAVGVPVLLLVAVVLWQDMPSLVLRGAGVAFLVAVGLLLWRMPHRRDDDDRGPGAVV